MGRSEPILVIEAPPRHGKSEFLCKYFTPWFLGTFPERKVILAMHSEGIARSYGRKARDLMEEWGPHIFGVKVRDDSAAAGEWNLAGHEGGMIAAGVGTGIPGRGAHVLIVDDPIKDAEAAKSETQREKIKDWWESTAFTRLEPGGVAIVIATRWHEDDLSGWLIRQAATGDGLPIRRLRLPALAEDGDPMGRQPGEALWEGRWPRQRLEALREGKTASWWNALYQQRPGRHEGATWPDTYFEDRIWEGQWPHAFELTAMAIDPSKGRQAGDFSGIVFAGLSGGKAWIDASIDRRPAEQIVSDSIDMSQKYQPMAVSLESNQWQDLLAPEFDRQCIERKIMPLPIHLTENRENKELRIARLGPYLKRDQLRFRDTVGCRRLVHQLREFPLSDHDDGPDALEMAIRKLVEIGSGQHDQDSGGYDYAVA